MKNIIKIIEIKSLLILFYCITYIPVYSQDVASIPLLYPELEGFPFQLKEGEAGRSSVNVGDIEGDGDLEICFSTSNGRVYMLHHTGDMVNGWPVDTEDNDHTLATPALVDLDNDGDLEVFVTHGTYLYAWHHDGSLVEGWPVSLDYSVESRVTPTIGDLDGDGDFEIIHGAYEKPCLVFAWHHDGTPVDGWPVTIPPGYLNHCDVIEAPALGDLDGDGTLEVVVGTRGGQVYVLNHDGTDFEGWPKEELEQISNCSPVIGDIDGDGVVDIVVGTYTHIVYAWDRYGSEKPGWPWESSGSVVVGVSLADLVGDEALEVIVNYMVPWNSNIYVIDGSTGSVLPGWPQPEEEYISSNQSLAVSDIDDDGEKELVMAGVDDCYNFHCNGFVVAYNADGTLVTGFPISLGYQSSWYAPCIVDFDQDGDLEICAVTDFGHIFYGNCYLHVWDLPHPYVEDQGDWRFLHHDPFHTNDFGFLLPTEGPIDVELEPDTVTVIRGGSFGLIASFTNRNVVYESFITGLFLGLPNGEPYGDNPLYGPYSLRVPLLKEESFGRILHIPFNAPLGNYHLLIPAGTSIHNIMDMDSTIVHVID